MKIVFFEIENPNTVEICEDFVSVIELCNSNMLYDFLLFCNGTDNNKFNLLDGNNTINIAKDGRLISDYINCDFLSKSMMLKLYDKLLLDSNEMQNATEVNSINHILLNLVNRLSNDTEIDFDWEQDILGREFLKFINLRLANQVTLKDNIINFLKVSKKFRLYKIIIFYNLKPLLQESEMNEIYKMALYLQQAVLIIESSHEENVRNYESKTLLDSDNFMFKFR